MTFGELEAGDEFEFDHSLLRGMCSSMVHGPWRKISTLYYVRSDDSEPEVRHRIGHVTATVIKAESGRVIVTCGGRPLVHSDR